MDQSVTGADWMSRFLTATAGHGLETTAGEPPKLVHSVVRIGDNRQGVESEVGHA